MLPPRTPAEQYGGRFITDDVRVVVPFHKRIGLICGTFVAAGLFVLFVYNVGMTHGRAKQVNELCKTLHQSQQPNCSRHSLTVN